MAIDKIQDVFDMDWWTAVKSLVLLSLFMYLGYALVQYYHERQVSLSKVVATTPHANRCVTQADIALERSLGCRLPPELPKRWPLGIDRIKELWESNADGRLLAFLCSIAKDYEPRNNLYQFLLIGPRAFHILHPKNVETLLSTNFKGWSSQLVAATII